MMIFFKLFISKISNPMIEETQDFLNYYDSWNFQGDPPPGGW